MDERAWLAERFEEARGHLRAVAYRILGSRAEAEDAVQEAWIRLSRSDTTAVDNLNGWLTTVVGRICLDMLRSKKSRREEELADAHPAAAREDGAHPERDAQIADSVGIALLVVLETLQPAERVAFVLHDMFDLPFEEIGPIVGRSATAARQLASRARRRVRGADAGARASRERQRQLVDAFFAASRAGDFNALIAVLDPEVVLRADRAAVRLSEANKAAGAPKLAAEVRGPAAVAETLLGRAAAARPAFIDGTPGAVWAPGGKVRAAFAFTFAGDRIDAIEIVVDPDRLARMEIETLG